MSVGNQLASIVAKRCVKSAYGTAPFAPDLNAIPDFPSVGGATGGPAAKPSVPKMPGMEKMPLEMTNLGGATGSSAANMSKMRPPSYLDQIINYIKNNKLKSGLIAGGGLAGAYGLSQLMGGDDDDEKEGSVGTKLAELIVKSAGVAPPTTPPSSTTPPMPAPAAPATSLPKLPPGPMVKRQQAMTQRRAASRGGQPAPFAQPR